jgi:hypothetical protein
MTQNIIIIGCGLHFRERYYSVLEQCAADHGLSIELVIDLDSQQTQVLDFFSDQALRPKNCIFVSEKFRNTISVADCRALFNPFINEKRIDAIMICTEPKAHKTYALWAIENQWSIFMDKPISAFDNIDKSNLLYDDYQEIQQALIYWGNVNFVVSCERRMHPGYQFIQKYIQEIVGVTKVPVTHIDIYFGGGMWNMPNEYFFRENHPYKYGYGVLLHSGYHYIDLMMQILNNNNLLFPVDPENIELKSYVMRPSDLIHILDNTFYRQYFPGHALDSYMNKSSRNRLQKFGETDLMMMGQLRNNSYNVTNLNMRLLETTASMREWTHLPENTYIDNGRLRQENIIIHIGPICSIQVLCGSKGFKKTVDQNGVENFDIRIINNCKITGKPEYIAMDRQDLSSEFPDIKVTEKLNIYSRQKQLKEFFADRDGFSGFSSHEDSMILLTKIFNSLNVYQNELKGENVYG